MFDLKSRWGCVIIGIIYMLYCSTGNDQITNQRNIGKNKLASKISNDLKENLHNANFQKKIEEIEPSWEVKKIDFDSLDQKLKKKIIDRITMLKLPNDIPSVDIPGIRNISHTGGNMIACHSSRILNHEPDSSLPKKFVNENRLDFREYDLNGEYQGRGQIIYLPTSDLEYFTEKPRPGMTYTEDTYRNKGLAYKRILHMNSLSQALFGKKLYSATLFSSPYAENVWKRLIKQGIAEVYHFENESGQQCRYRMK